MVVDDAMGLISENDLVKLNVGTPPPIAALLDQRDRELGVLAPGCTPLVETPREAGEQEIEIFIGDPFRPSQDAKRSTYLSTTFMLGLKAFDTGPPRGAHPGREPRSLQRTQRRWLCPFWANALAAQRCKTTIGFIDPTMMPVHGNVWPHVAVDRHSSRASSLHSTSRRCERGSVARHPRSTRSGCCA